MPGGLTPADAAPGGSSPRTGRPTSERSLAPARFLTIPTRNRVPVPALSGTSAGFPGKASDSLRACGGFGRLGITLEITSALDREIDGTESPRDVEELVEGLLAPKIKQIRRQEAEREHRARTDARRARSWIYTTEACGWL